MLPDLVTMLMFYDLCGYNSGWSRFTKDRKIALLICCIHVFMAACYLLYMFRLRVVYYSALRLVEAISECLQYTAALNAYLFILLDSFLQQQVHSRFWKVLERINERFPSRLNCTLRSYMAKIFVFLIKTVIYLPMRLMDSWVSILTDFSYVSIFALCEIRMFYYLLCLEVVYFQLKKIELESKSINEISRQNIIGGNKESHQFELQQLKNIRQYFHCVHEMICLLNKIFGWSNVAAISFCFHYLLTELHWYYNNFHKLEFVYKYGEYLPTYQHILILNLTFIFV